MKKILLVAMAAVLFMACENNGGGNSGMSGKDQAALSATTSKAVSFIGKNRTTAENAFKAAGYVELKEGSGLLGLPAKAPKKVQGIKKDGVTEVTYVYGVSDGQTEEELIQSLKDGNCVIVLEASFSGDIFVGSGVTFITAKSETVNRRFIFTSNEMYNSLPSNPALRGWEGTLAESAEDIASEGEEFYVDHSQFVAAINAMQEVAAVDAGTGFTSFDYNTGEYEGFGYYLAWINPSEEEFYESDLAYLGVPCAIGTYAVMDIDYMTELGK